LFVVVLGREFLMSCKADALSKYSHPIYCVILHAVCHFYCCHICCWYLPVRNCC